MPVPIALMSARISWFSRILWSLAFSTFRILPRMGRIAWKERSRACFALPPAESPSTMKISHTAGSESWQSASLPGSAEDSRSPLRLVRSRACLAAIRARAACWHFVTIRLPSPGCSSSQVISCSFTVVSTNERISVFPSLVLVCPSNWGSASFTATIAVSPSRMSSPMRFSSFSLRSPFARA